MSPPASASKALKKRSTATTNAIGRRPLHVCSSRSTPLLGASQSRPFQRAFAAPLCANREGTPPSGAHGAGARSMRPHWCTIAACRERPMLESHCRRASQYTFCTCFHALTQVLHPARYTPPFHGPVTLPLPPSNSVTPPFAKPTVNLYLSPPLPPSSHFPHLAPPPSSHLITPRYLPLNPCPPQFPTHCPPNSSHNPGSLVPKYSLTLCLRYSYSHLPSSIHPEIYALPTHILFPTFLPPPPGSKLLCHFYTHYNPAPQPVVDTRHPHMTSVHISHPSIQHSPPIPHPFPSSYVSSSMATPSPYTFSHAVSMSPNSHLRPYPYPINTDPSKSTGSISCTRFNPQGNLLAIGDDAGRIVLLFKSTNSPSRSGPFITSVPPISPSHRATKYHSRFPCSSPTSLSHSFSPSIPCDLSDSFQIPHSRQAYSDSSDDHDDDDPIDYDYDDYDDNDSHLRHHHLLYSYNGFYGTQHSSFQRHRRATNSFTEKDNSRFQYWAQFQSHCRQLDYLSSKDIDEKISHIEWFPSVANSHRLICSNDRVIKIWRLDERKAKAVTQVSPRPSPSKPVNIPRPSYHPNSFRRYGATPTFFPAYYKQTPTESRVQHPSTHSFRLRLPRIEHARQTLNVSERRIIADKHVSYISSLSVSPIDETFLSSDDLRVHLWDMNTHPCHAEYKVVDISPENMNELTEVITTTQYHPRHTHMFAYATSKGSVKLCDLRTSALCSSHAKTYEDKTNQNGRRTFISELIGSISSLKFSPDGRYILSRDFMNLCLWDVNMQNAPVFVIPVQEQIRSRLVELYDTDHFYDKFECAFSSDGRSLLTGSYETSFQSYSASTGYQTSVVSSANSTMTFESPFRATPVRVPSRRRRDTFHTGMQITTQPNVLDPAKRILHVDASSCENIAVGAANHMLYFYQG